MKLYIPFALVFVVLSGATASRVGAAPPTALAPVAAPVALRAGAGEPLVDLQLSSDGQTAFVSVGKSVEIYDLTARKLAQKVELSGVAGKLAVAANANAQSGQFTVRLNAYPSLTPTGPVSLPGSIEVHAYPATQQLKPTSATGMGENALGFARDGKMFAVVTDATIETIETVNLGNYRVAIYDQDGKALANVANQREGNTWFGAKSLSFSPDGARLLVGWNNGVLAIYDTANLKLPATKETPILPPVAVLPGHKGDITQLDWSQDGRLLASGDSEGLVQLWNWPSQQNVARWNVTSKRIWALAIAPDNATVAIAVENKGGEGTVQLWDVAGGRAKKIWKPPFSALQVAWMDEQTLLAGNRKGGVTLVPVAAFEPFRAPSPQPIDWTRPFFELAERQDIGALSWSRDGRWLASAGLQGIQLLDLKSGALVRVPQHHRNQITDVAFSPDAELLATSGYSGLEVVARATQILLWKRPSNSTAIAGWSPDGATIYLAEQGGQIAAFGARSGQLQTIIGHFGNDLSDQALSARLSPDGTRIAVTVKSAHKEDRYANDFYRSTLEVWNVASAKRLWQVTVDGECDAIAWTPDGQWLVAKVGDFNDGHRYSDGRMLFVPGKMGARWFDATTGKADATRSRMDLPAEVEALGFAPDGKTLAVALRGAKAQLWDGAGQFQRELDHSQSIGAWAFSSDGKHLAAGGESVPLRFWTPIGGF